MLRDGFSLKIGDGSSRVWYDPWVIKDNLCPVVPFVAIQDTNLKIKDIYIYGLMEGGI
jgi:hypothetical protein